MLPSGFTSFASTSCTRRIWVFVRRYLRLETSNDCTMTGEPFWGGSCTGRGGSRGGSRGGGPGGGGRGGFLLGGTPPGGRPPWPPPLWAGSPTPPKGSPVIVQS